MRLTDVVGYASANLKRHKVRTGLTVCGVALGIATLTVLVSLGSGLKLYATQQFDREELTTRVRVMPQGTKQATRARLQGGLATKPAEPLDDKAVADLAAIPGVKVAYPEVMTFIGAYANRRIDGLVAEAVPVAAQGAAHKAALLAGSYWTEDDAPAACVLPSALLPSFGFADPQSALGVELEVSTVVQLRDYRSVIEEVDDPKTGKKRKVQRFERYPEAEWKPIKVPVIGVYDSKAFGYVGRMLHVPKGLGIRFAKTLAVRQPYKENAYRQVLVKVADHRELDRVEQAIQAKGYETQSVFNVLKQLRVAFIAIQVLLFLFGGIGVAVAFFGIANTMVMAVLERTREIGVLKAIGARDRDVRRMFLVEAAGIGAIGGAVGVAGGWFVGQVLNAIALQVFPPLQEAGLNLFVLEGWLIGVYIGLATGVATVAGLIPAIRASRLPPVDALRRD